MDRRQVLAALGASALVSYGSAARAEDVIRRRRNILSFNATEIAALREGVRVMKNRSDANLHDPRGWNYWASIHFAYDVPPELEGIYKQCDHSYPGYTAEHFLSWHRAYLHYFDLVLREASGSDALSLPYWDWYANQTVPTVFTEGNEQTNPLWHNRKSSPRVLRKGAFTHGHMLPKTSGADGFSAVLEGNPHGTVHGMVGGDMGQVGRSSRDPIFWLHHANIDRLWSAWLRRSGLELPAEADEWSRKSFRFDVAGQWSTTAYPMLRSANLGYDYDDENEPPPDAARAFNATRLLRGATRSPLASPEAEAPSVSAAPSFSIGREPLTLELPFTAQQGRRLSALASEAPPRGGNDLTAAWLVIENIQVTEQGRDGGFDVGVLLLDGESSTLLHSINTFSLSTAAMGGDHTHHAGGGAAPVTLRIPITAPLQQLGADGLSNRRMRVGLEPQVGFEGEADALIRVGSYFGASEQSAG